MKTLIKNGTVVTASNEYRADLLVDGETIAAIGGKLDIEADRVIDAGGKYILPGGIDQHTHFSALCNSGDRDTAGYESTQAVIVGGTTTIVDYAPQDPGKGLVDSIHHRINVRAKDKACVDFALHSLVTEVNESIFEEALQLPEHGVASIKLFMAYKGSPLHVDDGTLYKMLLRTKEVGVAVFVHAENAELIDRLQQDCVRSGRVEPKYHAVSRPPFVETEATRRAICIAEAAGAPLYIVHMSTRGSVEALLEARSRGLVVQGETCTQYLTTTRDRLDHPDFNQAAQFVCSPALRDQEDLDFMWEMVRDGKLTAIVSDHCGIDLKEMKQEGRNDFTQIPNGAPGAADRFNMIWTQGVAAGRMTRQRFVELCSTNPAKLNGIYPQKGTIDVGSDADIVIMDPHYRGTVRWQDNPNGVDYNIYEGRELHGRPEIVLLRGSVVVENGAFTGKLGQGRFIHSKAYAGAFTGL